MEAKLQKLKVTELKELLAKHHLVQTGKKDDLIKRLLDNNVGVEGEGHEQEHEPLEELVDFDLAESEANAAPQTDAVLSAAAAQQAASATPAAVATANEPTSTSDTATTVSATTTTDELTPEQKAMKARAERFGVPFNPNPTPKAKPITNAKSNTANVETTTTAKPASKTETPAQEKEKKVKVGAIDSNPLGLSEEVLARRAAKFGLPEKKEKSEAVQVEAPKAKTVEKQEEKKEEISPELAQKLAVEEEKKRKRAEKFGTVKPATPTATTTNGSGASNGDSEPDAKKVKV